MKVRTLVTAIAVMAMTQIAWNVGIPPSAHAQGSAMKDDIEQLAMDLHVGIDRSSLTPQQKQQIRDDLEQLRAARRDHTPLKGLEAARRIRSALDSGAFKPEDKQRIQEDMKAIREAREDKMGYNVPSRLGTHLS